MSTPRLLKALRPPPPKSPPPRIAGVFAPPYPERAGGTTTRPSSSATTARGSTRRSTPSPRKRRGTGRSSTATPARPTTSRRPLPHTHPLCRLLDRPNPWLTPWELWYLTVVYLELTGNAFWYVAPQSVGETRLGTPGEIWIIPTPWVRIVPDRTRVREGVPGRARRACRRRRSARTRSFT